jgi:hypothetical protein
MELYLYPWLSENGDLIIKSIKARNYSDCIEKLSKQLTDQYELLDDTLEYPELISQLGEIYGVYIGEIYDITEL